MISLMCMHGFAYWLFRVLRKCICAVVYNVKYVFVQMYLLCIVVYESKYSSECIEWWQERKSKLRIRNEKLIDGFLGSCVSNYAKRDVQVNRHWPRPANINGKQFIAFILTIYCIFQIHSIWQIYFNTRYVTFKHYLLWPKFQISLAVYHFCSTTLLCI